MRVSPVSTPLTVAERVTIAQSEIRMLVLSGRMPATVPDFASVHGYTDGNELGRLCELGTYPPVPSSPGEDVDTIGAREMDMMIGVAEQVQGALDTWIRSGALVYLPELGARVRFLDTDAHGARTLLRTGRYLGRSSSGGYGVDVSGFMGPLSSPGPFYPA